MCCFCGGSAPSTTEDHVPSRAFFNGRVWPEGFNFPACDQCQQATSKHELLVAVVARIGKINNSADAKAQNLELMRGVNNNFPGLLGQMVQSPTEKRKWLREQGFEIPPGQSTQDLGLFSVTDQRIQEAMLQFGRKLFCGLFYLRTGMILPRTGGIAFRWFTNANFHEIPEVLAVQVLGWLVEEEIPARRTVLKDYFSKHRDAPKQARDAFIRCLTRGEDPPVRPILIFIDEFAEIMLSSGPRAARKFEDLVQRAVQTGRSTLVHLLLATQRPSVNVIKGSIKANLPSRVALAVPAYVDSTTILNSAGAEDLLGKGDMLFLASDGSITRLQAYDPG